MLDPDVDGNKSQRVCYHVRFRRTVMLPERVVNRVIDVSCSEWSEMLRWWALDEGSGWSLCRHEDEVENPK